MKTKRKHVKILMTTNKVANELNKLARKPKYEQGGKKATLPTRDSRRGVKEERRRGGGGGSRGGGAQKLQWVFIKKHSETWLIYI